MSVSQSCPCCGSLVPPVAQGDRLQCPDCGSVLPAAVEASSQWFVTLPDGRKFGPLSAQQMLDASQAGKIAAEALVRRGDWKEAIPHAQFLAQQAQSSTDRTANASYGKQFKSNPLATYFFGPELAEYRGQQGAELKAMRKRHFRRWVYLLVTMVLAAVFLPLIAGLIRGNAELALGGVLLGLIVFFWPTIVFVLGMLMYAGAWFEWGWFFRSRGLRHARGMFGDSGARKFYLAFGGILMVGGAFFSLGSSLVIAGSFLFTRDPQVVAAGNRVQVAEQNVAQTRQLFETNAIALREHLEQIDTLKAAIARQPNELRPREQLLKAQQRLPEFYADYRLYRDQWQGSVTRLEQQVDEEGTTSRVLRSHREVPHEYDFSDQVFVPEADQFPLDQVRMAAGRLVGSRRHWEQMQSATSKVSQAAIDRLAGEIDQQRSFLLGIQQKHGYHAPELDGLPTTEELSALVARGQVAPGNIPAKTRLPEKPAVELPAAPDEPPLPIKVAGNQPPGAAGPPFARLAMPVLTRFDPERQTLRGKVTLENAGRHPSLITEALQEHAIVYFDAPTGFPRYEVEADVTRLDGDGAFFLVLTVQGAPAALVIDGGPPPEHRTGLVAVDNQVLASPHYPDKLLSGTQFPKGRTVHLLCSVEGNRLTLQVDGQQVYEWQGQVSRLSLPPFYRSEHRHKLHTGSFQSRYRLEKVGLRMR
jgi:hypothetical protein